MERFELPNHSERIYSPSQLAIVAALPLYAPGETRTRKPVKATDFKSGVYTDSTTGALVDGGAYTVLPLPCGRLALRGGTCPLHRFPPHHLH